MELTREDSISKAIELWTWMAGTGKEKSEWPGWEEYGGASNDCPLCDYGIQQVALEEAEDACEVCPYYQKFGGCCNADSPYLRWACAPTVRERKKYATLFLEQLKQL